VHQICGLPEYRTMNASPLYRASLAAVPLLCLSLLSACGGYGGMGSGAMGMGMCGGAYSGPCTPSVTVTNAAGNVSGMGTLTASASAQGNNIVSAVQFMVDGVAVGAADTSAPYNYVWDSTTVANGTHQITAVVTDSAHQMVTSPAVTLTVNNGSGNFAVQLAPDQLFPQPASTATGTGNFSADASSGQFSGSVTLVGVTATGAEIGDAYAGAQSPAVITLGVDPGNVNQWDVPAATILTAQQLADLAAGKFYVLVRSALFPSGELRAQLLPGGIVVRFAALSGSAEVPPVATTATGQVAVTVDAANLHAAAHVNVAGLAATGAELDSGAAGVVGSTLATLVVDASDSNHYFNESITLASADVTDFNNSLWYANVFSVANATGELRGQIVQPMAATLSP
jgi:CHRD domain-containing protein/Big-like domain-containing protein